MLSIKGKNLYGVIARVIGGLAILFFIVMVFGELIVGTVDDAVEDSTIEGFLVVAFSTLLLAAFIFAFKKELPGGKILTLLGLIFAVFIYFSAGTNRIIASVFISIPFWASGILFILSGRVKNKN